MRVAPLVVLCGLAVATFCLSYRGASAAPSFDCGNARTTVEKVICDSPKLSDLDADLKVAYDTRLNQLSAAEKKTLVEEQRTWLKKRVVGCEASAPYTSITPDRRSFITKCLTSEYLQRIEMLRAGKPEDSDYYRLVMSSEDRICRPLSDVYNKLAMATVQTYVQEIDEDSDSDPSRMVHPDNSEWEIKDKAIFEERGFGEPKAASPSRAIPQGDLSFVYYDDVLGNHQKHIFYMFRALFARTGTRDTLYVFNEHFEEDDLRLVKRSALNFFVDFAGVLTPIFDAESEPTLNLVPLQGYILKKWGLAQKQGAAFSRMQVPSMTQNRIQHAFKYKDQIIFIARQNNGLDDGNVILVYSLNKSNEMHDICYLYHSSAF